jgi:hypothetical protein
MADAINNVTELRPKADPTNADRQRRHRARRQRRVPVSCCSWPRSTALLLLHVGLRRNKPNKVRISYTAFALRRLELKLLAIQKQPTKQDACQGVPGCACLRFMSNCRCVPGGRPRMDAHKYRIGQAVIYRSPGADALKGEYVIIARLPQRDHGELEYRIKHSHELHQRNAKESELRLK